MTKKLILFDFDGTLVDSESINILALSETITSFGHLGYSFEEIKKKFIGLSASSISTILQKDNITNIEEIINLSNNLAIEIARKQLKAIPEVIDTLEKIKIPFCIASNGQRHMVMRYLQFTNLDTFFEKDRIFTSADVLKPKPHPDLFLHAANRMGNQNPSECLIVEDSTIGITAARLASIEAVGLVPLQPINSADTKQKEKELLDAGAKYIINHFSELLNYL